MTTTLPTRQTAVGYGCPKTDYDAQVNPLTDLSLESEYEPAVVDTAALGMTGPRTLVHVDADAGGGEDILDHTAMWGETAGVEPTLLRNAAGSYTLTWTASQSDLNPTVSRQNTNTLNFRFATATVAEDADATISVSWTANTVTVLTYAAGGVKTDYDFVVVVY